MSGAHPNHSSLAVANATPFKPSAKGAKLAVDTPAWTRTYSSKIQFDGVVGADGYAQIMFNPSPYQDRASIWYSNSAATNMSVPFNNMVEYAQFASATGSLRTASFCQPGLAAQCFSSLPFAARDAFGVPANIASATNGAFQSSWCPPSIRARVVSAGYKVSFTGSTLNDQGIFYNFVEPNHENLLGQTLQGYASPFTSLKPQRAAVRGIVENTVGPINRKQMELSEGYEDSNVDQLQAYSLSYGSTSGSLPVDNTPDAAQTGILLAPCSRVDRPQNFSSRTQFAVISPANSSDWIQSARALVSLLYPLSRRNAAVYQQLEQTTAGAALTRTLALSATGIATWVNPPQQIDNLIYSVQLGSSGSSASVGQVFVWYSPEFAGWKYCLPNSPQNFISQSATQANIIGAVTAPPIIAATVLQGFQPGSTFHVEAVIHVEYSGREVQGSTTPCVPDPLHQSVIQQAVMNAREHAAQHEHARPQDSFVHSVIQTAAHHAPDLAMAVISTVAPEAAPTVTPIIGMLNSFSKKRKLH